MEGDQKAVQECFSATRVETEVTKDTMHTKLKEIRGWNETWYIDQRPNAYSFASNPGASALNKTAPLDPLHIPLEIN